jgi:mRNA interferase MazF
LDCGRRTNGLGQAVKLSRGDVIIAVFPGELGKPRPAVVLQANEFLISYTTVLSCPLTTHLLDAPFLRPRIEPTLYNGLQNPSQVMVEKITPVRKEAIGQRVGQITDNDMRRIEIALAYVTGLTSVVVPGQSSIKP